MQPILKIAAVVVTATGAFIVKQYRSMLGHSKKVTKKLQDKKYTIYTGKLYEESDLYDDRVFEETRSHYYDQFYKSGNVSPGMLKGMFKWKYAKKITKKDVKDVFTDIGVNTGRFAEECIMSYNMSKKYTKLNKKMIKKLIK